MKQIFFVLLIAFTSQVFAQEAADQTLEPVISNAASCKNNPSLCAALDDVLAAFSWTCRGDVCFEIWENQISAMQNLVSIVDGSDLQVVDKSLGLKAQRLTSYACSHSATMFDRSLLFRLVNSQNQMFRRLQMVQANTSPRISVFPCHKTIR